MKRKSETKLHTPGIFQVFHISTGGRGGRGAGGSVSGCVFDVPPCRLCLSCSFWFWSPVAFRFGFRCRVCSLPAFRNCPQKWTPKRRSGKEVKHPNQKEVQTKGTRTATVTCWGHCCQKKPLQVPLFILMVVSAIRFSTRLEASWHSLYCSYVQEEQPFLPHKASNVALICVIETLQ